MEHVAQVLVQLFAVLLAAKVGDEVFKRLGQPTVIGEILGGLVVGPAVLGIYEINPETSLFAEIGVVLLLFQVGVETRLGDLLRVGWSAGSVGVLGVALPLGAGWALARCWVTRSRSASSWRRRSPPPASESRRASWPTLARSAP